MIEKLSSAASDILRKGLQAARRNNGAVVNQKGSFTVFKNVDKARNSGRLNGDLADMISGMGIPKGKSVTVGNNPVSEFKNGRPVLRQQDRLARSAFGEKKSLLSGVKDKFTDAKYSLDGMIMNKSNKKAIRGITGFHEAAERNTSGRIAASIAGQSRGHNSVSGVIGRAEHNNLRKPEFQKELKSAKNYIVKSRSLGHNSEAESLKKFTPTNQKGVQVELGNPSSPRINRSLALRMQAKELGLPLNGGSANIKKMLRKQKKQIDEQQAIEIYK